jgi:PAS domain S-box-containing protein
MMQRDPGYPDDDGYPEDEMRDKPLPSLPADSPGQDTDQTDRFDAVGPVHARQVQEATYRISQAAATADNLQQLYGYIHHIVAELMPAENLYLALRDPQTGFITYPYYVDEFDIVPPDPQTAETGLTAHILQTGEALLLSEFEEAEPIKSADVVPTGTRPVTWLGVPLKLNGKPIGVIAVQVYHGSYRYTTQDCDILTFVADQIAVSIDRQRSSDALTASEERFRIAAQSTSDVIYEWDVVKDQSIYCGDVQGELATAIGGFPTKGSEWDSFIHPEDLPGAQHAIQEHLMRGKPLRVTYRIRCTDGSWRTVIESSRAIRDAGGTVVKWIGSTTDITERVKTEEALRASEAKMRAILAAMTDAIVVLDKDGRYIEIAPTGASLLYRPPSELLGKTVHEVFERDLADRFLERIQRALATHATVDMDYGLDIARAHLWFEARLSVLTDDQVVFVAHDATARHNAQTAAKLEASKAESYFNTSGVIMEVTDLDLRLVRLNRKGYEFFGTTPEEVVGTDWFDIKLPERERARVKAIVQRELAGDDISPYTEGPVVTRTGEERIVAWHDSLLRDADGTVTGVISSGVDVTDRVRAERALQASELKFKELFNHAQDAIFLYAVNADDTMAPIIEANDIACRWVGWPREELLRHTIEDIIVDEAPDLFDRIGQRLQEWGTASFSTGLRARDGHLIPVEISTSLFVLEGRPVVLSIVHDITNRLRLEGELQRMDKLESLGVLAGGIAHDFNNMLTGIIGNIDLARIENSPDNARDLLGEAEQELLRARGLTQQLLTFARGGSPVRSVQDLAPILREVTGFALRGSDVRASVDLPQDLWWANVDRGQIGQVFSNIVINANEAMPNGGTLSVTARNVTLTAPMPHADLVPGQYVRIDISDGGVGIAEGDLHKVFDPFFSTKRRGSGLGLATSYAILHKHDGYIDVASKLGAGTTFSIFLPAVSTSPAPTPVNRTASVNAGGRALVMDDEPTVRQVLVAMLGRLGYQAEAVPDGASAVRADAEAKAAGRPFSVIIMDLTIPGGMGGQEAAGLLRVQHTAARLIVSSGYATDPVMANYRSYLFDAVLTKPYSFSELADVLASLAEPTLEPPQQ